MVRYLSFAVAVHIILSSLLPSPSPHTQVRNATRAQNRRQAHNAALDIPPDSDQQASGTGTVYMPMVTHPPVAERISRYFATLPPGSALPDDGACASVIKARDEIKGMNTPFNAIPGTLHLASDFFGWGDARANTEIAPRVTGHFVGTTDEILQWGACKWGLDEDIVRAIAVVESTWRQTTKGDWTSNADLCPPGHPLGFDGRAGQCPQSWGLLQVQYRHYKSSWPESYTSTAFSVDTALAVWRACFEGYEWWLSNPSNPKQYQPGDAWGCLGRWFSGGWYNHDAVGYIGRAQQRLVERTWEQANFPEP
jgi:hypothetical protein